jgi:hypothetical protein
MARAIVLSLMSAAVVVVLALSPAHAAPPPPVSELAASAPLDPDVPRQIHLAFTEEPGGLLFSWTTGTPIWAGTLPRGAPLPTVQLGTQPDAYTATASGNYSVQYNATGDIIHRVNVTGLAWSTRYYYIVGDASIGVFSGQWSFVTPSGPGAESPAAFIAYGDMGYWSGSSTVVQADVLQELTANGPYDAVLHVVRASASHPSVPGRAGVKASAPQFLTLSRTDGRACMTVQCLQGDISYAGLEGAGNLTLQTQLWDTWFGQVNNISATTPYMVSPG